MDSFDPTSYFFRQSLFYYNLNLGVLRALCG